MNNMNHHNTFSLNAIRPTGLLHLLFLVVLFACASGATRAWAQDEITGPVGNYKVVDVVLHDTNGLLVPAPSQHAQAFAGFRQMMINAAGGGHFYKFSKKNNTVEIAIGKEKAEANVLLSEGPKLTIENDVTGIIDAPFVQKGERLLIYLQLEEIQDWGVRPVLVLLKD